MCRPCAASGSRPSRGAARRAHQEECDASGRRHRVRREGPRAPRTVLAPALVPAPGSRTFPAGPACGRGWLRRAPARERARRRVRGRRHGRARHPERADLWRGGVRGVRRRLDEGGRRAGRVRGGRDLWLHRVEQPRGEGRRGWRRQLRGGRRRRRGRSRPGWRRGSRPSPGSSFPVRVSRITHDCV